jgi:hypothetical protein
MNGPKLRKGLWSEMSILVSRCLDRVSRIALPEQSKMTRTNKTVVLVNPINLFTSFRKFAVAESALLVCNGGR